MNIKKIILASAVIILAAAQLFAGGSSRFRLEKNKDILLLAAGGGTIVTGMVLKSFSVQPRTEPAAWLTWPVFPYRKDLADASNYLVAAGIAAIPFLLDSWDWNEAATIGVMYGEALSLSWGIKESLKAVFTKYRPYTSFSDTPADLLSSDDRYYSFPSGHTSVAFTTAGFATAVFAASDASSGMKYLFGGINFALAAGVASLRVTSGEHYFVDVAAAALLGTASGILVPALHRLSNRLTTHLAKEAVAISITPATAELRFSY